MLSRLTARMAFAIAIGLLAVCAILVYSTLVNFSKSEQLVYHTQQVRELLSEAESDTEFRVHTFVADPQVRMESQPLVTVRVRIEKARP